MFEKVQDVNEPQDIPEIAGVASILIAATPTMEAIVIGLRTQAWRLLVHRRGA